MNESLEEKKEFLVDEVFTPASPAIACYVPRGEKVNDKLVNALKTRGKQIVVYGHSGSGKTTLLLNKLNQTYSNHLTSRCMKTTTVESLMLDAFSQLAPFYETEYSNTKKSGAELHVESTFKEIKAGIKLSSTSESTIKSGRLALLCHVTHADAGLSWRRNADTERKLPDKARREWPGVPPVMMVAVAVPVH